MTWRNHPQDRRERSKLAQRAYRKRHAKTFAALKDESARLKDAIRKISDAAASRRWSPDLAAALDEARELAEIGPPPPPPPRREGEEEREEEEEVLSDQSTLYVASEAKRSPPPQPEREIESFFTTAQLRPSQPAPTRFDFGLCLDPEPGTPKGETVDLTPYLGDNMRTLGGRIYWASLTLAVLDVQRIARSRPDSSGTGGGSKALLAANMSLNAIFGSEHVRDPAFYKACQQLRDVHTRNDFLCLDDPCLAEVQRSLLRGGGRSAHWKTARETADYILSLLTPDEAALVRGVAAGTHVGWGREAVGVLVRELMHNAVFVGYWPMWNSIYLSMLAGTWLRLAGNIGPADNCFARARLDENYEPL